MRAWLAVALVLAHTGVTSFEQGEQGGIILPVRLNGRGPFQFLLDTGSTHTSVSQRTALAIGAPVVAKAPMASVAGSRETLVARIDALEARPLVASKVLASVVELDDLRGRDAIDGVLGQDVLDQVRYTI